VCLRDAAILYSVNFYLLQIRHEFLMGNVGYFIFILLKVSMKNNRNFDVSALNIRAHRKHAPSEYVELWRMLHRSKRHVTHANTALMIGEVHYEDRENPLANLYGQFTDSLTLT
jgi:hypothetical protein